MPLPTTGPPLKRKRCHGNRKKQRFRRQCRQRGIQPERIEQLLKRRELLEITNRSNTSDGQNRLKDTTGSTAHVLITKKKKRMMMQRKKLEKKEPVRIQLKKTKNYAMVINYRYVFASFCCRFFFQRNKIHIHHVIDDLSF